MLNADVAALTVDELLSRGEALRAHEFQPVQQSQGRLSARIASISAQGSTALGPALALAVGMKPKEIVVCSDGEVSMMSHEQFSFLNITYLQPNVGVGSLQNSAMGAAFYQNIGKTAQEREISISCLLILAFVGHCSQFVAVIGIQGNDCGFGHMKVCSELTGGVLNTLSPLELDRQLRQLSQNPVVATDVQMSFYAPACVAANGNKV